MFAYYTLIVLVQDGAPKSEFSWDMAVAEFYGLW